MLRRLRIYFTGFAIGLILVYVIFGKDDSRDLDIWTPSQRILEAIREDSTFIESANLACFQSCLSLSDSTLKDLWVSSKVKSLNPGGNPYRYLISLKTDSIHLEAEVEKVVETHRLLSLKNNQNPKACLCE